VVVVPVVVGVLMLPQVVLVVVGVEPMLLLS
jgi:hypothetical protein